jgi:hypothetical protein
MKAIQVFGRQFNAVTLFIVLNLIASFPLAMLAWIGITVFFDLEFSLATIINLVIFVLPVVASLVAVGMGIKYETSDRLRAWLYVLMPLPLSVALIFLVFAYEIKCEDSVFRAQRLGQLCSPPVDTS